MPFFDLPASRLTADHVQSLVSDRICEGQFIEFKRELNFVGEEAKKEVVADITAFANASGGYIIYGVEEVGGVASKICGIQCDDVDKKIRGLQELVRARTRPALTLNDVAPVRAGDLSVIVIRISRSWLAPHQHTFPGSVEFYSRAGSTKYRIEVDELRELFMRSPNLAARAREFRVDRSARIAAGDTPITLQTPDALIVHVAPITAFDQSSGFNMQFDRLDSRLFGPMPEFRYGGEYANFDGFLITSNADSSLQEQRAYTQLLRSGAIEAVASSITRGSEKKYLNIVGISHDLAKCAHRYMTGLARVNCSPPFCVFLSLVNVNGARFIARDNPTSLDEDLPGCLIRQSQLHFVEALFEDCPQTHQATTEGLRRTLDQLANAAGFRSSPLFD